MGDVNRALVVRIMRHGQGQDYFLVAPLSDELLWDLMSLKSSVASLADLPLDFVAFTSPELQPKFPWGFRTLDKFPETFAVVDGDQLAELEAMLETSVDLSMRPEGGMSGVRWVGDGDDGEWLVSSEIPWDHAIFSGCVAKP